MIWLATLLAALHGGLVSFDDKNSQYRLRGDSGVPQILLEDDRYKSFSGQDYTEVRLPYGANPNFVKTVADVTMIDTDKYRQSYQENIRNVQILTEDFRLDDQFFTNKNNYSNWHQPEAGISKIDQFWKLRHEQRNRS